MRCQNRGITAACVKGWERAERLVERNSTNAGGSWCSREGASAALREEGVSAMESRRPY